MKTTNHDLNQESNWNEIILDPKGNTYVGALAQRFATNSLKLPTTFKLDDRELFHVFEVRENNEVVHRASQSTRRLAQSYMSPERVCVYHRNTPPTNAELLAEVQRLRAGLIEINDMAGNHNGDLRMFDDIRAAVDRLAD